MVGEWSLPRHSYYCSFNTSMRTRAVDVCVLARGGERVAHERIIRRPDDTDEEAGEQGEKEDKRDEEGAEWRDGGVLLWWHRGMQLEGR